MRSSRNFGGASDFQDANFIDPLGLSAANPGGLHESAQYPDCERRARNAFSIVATIRSRDHSRQESHNSPILLGLLRESRGRWSYMDILWVTDLYFVQ